VPWREELRTPNRWCCCLRWWWALKTDESRLKQLVNEFNQLQKKINEERKITSDCALAPMPKVEFAEGLCTATTTLSEASTIACFLP
jgi:hypothetical protein